MWEGKEPKVQKAPGNSFQFCLGDRSFNFLSSFTAGSPYFTASVKGSLLTWTSNISTLGRAVVSGREKPRGPDKCCLLARPLGWVPSVWSEASILWHQRQL